MRHSLLVLLSLAMCQLLTTATLLVADDPPLAQRTTFTQRTNYDKLSALVQTSQLSSNAAASCASTACHGGPRPGVAQSSAIRGAEYPLWLERDPHAQAYRSLCSELGTSILQRLNILEGMEITDRAAFNNCLACHNSTQQAVAGSTTDVRTEGVACDRCHGPSQAWRNTHYTDQWPAIAAGQSAHDVGFIINQDLLTRARMCASCHVGDRQRNMNHDMIAAGHPPLLYEFTTYHNRLPKHWRDSRTKDAEHYESTLWFVGQIAALEGQVALIEARAETAADTGAWPEFAHLDCAGCHQPLTANRSTEQPSSRARWSRWQRWGVETILTNEPTNHSQLSTNTSASKLRAAIDKLDALLQSQVADRRDVRASAAELQDALNQWVTSPSLQTALQRFSASQLKSLLSESRSSLEGTSKMKPNWETLSQLYLAGVATRGQWPDIDKTNNSSMSAAYSLAEQLRRQLLFSPNNTVPHFQVSASTTSDAIEFLKALQQSNMQAAHGPPSSIRSKP